MLAFGLIGSYGLLTLAQDKTGTKPSVISLPTGPGSIEGLGKSFQPHLNSGSFSYSVPIVVPHAAGGFAPEIELAYDTGFGNSVLGVGWRISVNLEIERQTEKGFPRYRDSISPGNTPGSTLPQDTFVFQGEELVSLSDGTFRTRDESAFRRFRPIASIVGGARDSWIVEDRNGVKHWLGRYNTDPLHPDSRVTNPFPPDDGLGQRSPLEDTFSWYEDAAEDLSGNRIEYTYTSDLIRSPGVLYLSEIRYFARREVNSYHSISFLYDIRNDVLDDNRAGMDQRLAWRCREIVISSVYGGVTHHLRSYVLDYDPHSGAIAPEDAAPGEIPAQIDNGLSRLYAITQYGSTHQPGTGHATGVALPPTRLAYSQLFLRSPSPAYLSQLHPLSLRLREGEPDPLVFGPVERGIKQLDPGSDAPASSVLDFDLSDPRVQFVDMNGDGLPDVLDTSRDSSTNASGLYHVAWNLGQDTFGRQQFSTVDANPPLDARGQDIAFADVTGDGVVDLLEVTRTGGTGQTRVFRNLHDPGRSDSPTGFGKLIIADAPPPGVTLTGPNVRMMDLNFDKKADLLVSSPDGLSGYIWSDAGWRPFGRRPWSQGLGDGGMSRAYQFSITDPVSGEHANPLVQLADMNGDRLLDLVRVSVTAANEVEIAYMPLVGPMQWGKEVVFNFANPNGSDSGIPGRFRMSGILPGAFDASNNWQSVKLLDVNGDGLTDVVFLGPNKVAQVFLNCGGRALLGPIQVQFQSEYHPDNELNPTTLRTLDIDGNGSTDLVFFQKASRTLTYLDFTSGQKPGLLQVVDNGIGKRSFLRYRPATADLVRSQKHHANWLTTTPNALWVLSAIVETGEPDPSNNAFQVATFDYRDGYYDPFEKQFRGFAFVQKTVWGDDLDSRTGQSPVLGAGHPGARTEVSRFRFHTGSPDGVDNEEYIGGFDVGVRPASPIAANEIAGFAEEPLKGKLIWIEVADGAVLGDPQADFDLCASRVDLAISSGNAYGPAASSCAPDRYVLKRTIHNWSIRRLYRPANAVWPKGRLLREEPNIVATNGKSVSFAIETRQTEQEIEANAYERASISIPGVALPATAPFIRGTFFDYDDYGNIILIHEEGNRKGASQSYVGGRVTRRSYILTRGSSGSIDRWILNRPLRERVEGENGQFARETQYFYDGPDFVGLAAGNVGLRGLTTRIQKRVRDGSSTVVDLDTIPDSETTLARISSPGNALSDSPEWIDAERRSYDEYGNVAAILDPLATTTSQGTPNPAVGHFRTILYDTIFHSNPISESLELGSTKTPLVFSADYQRVETAFSVAVPLGSDVITRSTDPNGNVTDYLFDGFYRLTGIVRPGDSEALPTVVYSYRPADSYRSLIYGYTRKGESLALGKSATALRQPLANAVQTDRRLVSGRPEVFTSIAYTDGFGHLLMSLTPSGHPGRFDVRNAAVYDATGEPRDVFQPYEQLDATYQFPPKGSESTTFWRDAVGRVVRTLLPNEFDGPVKLRRESRQYYLPLCQYRFDEEDITASDSRNSHVGTPTVYCKDRLGRLASIQETVHDGDERVLETRYRYDLNDQLFFVRDGQGNVQWSRLDGLGRRLFRQDPDSGATRYIYDDASNLVEQIDNAKQRISWTYDGANRIQTTEYYDEHTASSTHRRFDPTQRISAENRPDIAYFYDEPAGPLEFGAAGHGTATNTRGMLAYVMDLSGEEHLSYDSRGRVAWKLKRISADGKTSVGYRFVRAFDAMDRLTTLTLPDGLSVIYQYDTANRLSATLLGSGKPILQRAEYSPAGQPLLYRFGNGVSTSYEYDSRLRTTVSRTTASGATSALQGFRYSYDGVSNITRMEDLRSFSSPTDGRNDSRTYRYDDLYRLVRVEYPHLASPAGSNRSKQISYAYDDIGNLVAQTSNMVQSAASNSPTDLGKLTYGGHSGTKGRLGRQVADPGPHAVSEIGSKSTLTYDLVGNVTRIKALTLTWNFAHQLVAVDSSEMHSEYVYDYSGSRVAKRTWKKTAGAWAGSAPDNWTVYAGREYETQPSGPTDYIWVGDTRVARCNSSHPDRIEWFHGDQTGSTALVTDNAGHVREETTYDPFGEIRHRALATTSSASSTETEYYFAGKEHDAESGLDYFGARYLSAGLGRFLSVDPVVGTAVSNPQDLNPYAYGRNNPIKFIDSNGNSATVAGFLIGAAVGGGISLAQGKSWTEVGQSALSGGLSGAAAGFVIDTGGLGLGVVALSGAIGGVTHGALDRSFSGQANTWQNVATDAGVGAAGSFLGYGIARGGAAALAALGGSSPSGLTSVVSVLQRDATELAETAGSVRSPVYGNRVELFRGVGTAEAISISETGGFGRSPQGTEFKGFFFTEADAQTFSARMTNIYGDPYRVVSAEAPSELVGTSQPHSAATEGPGVLIRNEDLPQVTLKQRGPQ